MTYHSLREAFDAYLLLVALFVFSTEEHTRVGQRVMPILLPFLHGPYVF